MPGARTALLIATDTYTDSAFGQLRAPEQDVKELAEVLRDKEIGEFQVDVLINRPSHEISIRINKLFQQAERNDLVLLYLSGHGIKDESGQLLFASKDTRRDLLASTAIRAPWIRELMDDSLAKQVVLWLDCCYGGAFPAGMIPKAAATVDVVPQLAPPGRGSAVMTASTHVQFAFEGDHRLTDKIRPSLFTSAIVEGLRTGDADRNADGEIDIYELYAYVHEQVTRQTPNQTPTRNDRVAGDIYIAHSRRGIRLHPDLPAEIRQALRSQRSAIRLGAVQSLFLMATSADEAERAMAGSTLNQLAAGHDQALAAAALAAISKLNGPPAAPAPPEPPKRARAVEEKLPEPPARLRSPATAPLEPHPDVVVDRHRQRTASPSRDLPRVPAPVIQPATSEARVRLHLPKVGRWVGLGYVILWLVLAAITALLAMKIYSVDHGTRQAVLIGAGLLAAASLVLVGVLAVSLARLISRSATLSTNSANATDIAFRPDAGALVCGGQPGAVWDTASWVRKTDTIHIGHHVAFSPNGALLAMARTSHIRILAQSLTMQVGELPVQVVARSLAFSPEGSVLAATSGENVSIWRTSDWRLVGTLAGHTGAVNSLAFNARAGLLATAGDDRTVKLWNTHDWTLYRTLRAPNHAVCSVAFSPSGQTLVSSDWSKLIFWDTERWSPYRTLKTSAGAIAFHPAGDLLAYASSTSAIKLMNLKTTTRRTLLGHRWPVTALAFSPNGELLASASRDGTVRLWPIRQTAN